MSVRARTIFLEVERKFVPSLHFIRRLEANSGLPPFRQLQRLQPTTFEDTYHDLDNSLNSRGIWLRARSGIWQAKVRLGGDFTNSKFQEIDDYAKIAELVKEHVPQAITKDPCFGLSTLARFKTFRHKWQADERFKIVFDRTDFGHEIGEVELTFSTIQEHEMPEAIVRYRRGEVLKRMDRDLEEFMNTYAWAFRTSLERPIGKLSAYFAMQSKGFNVPEGKG